MSAPVFYTVRPAEPRDIESVAALERICFGDPWRERSIAEGLNGGNWVFLVAETELEIVGYGIAWVVAGEGEVARVGVAPELRGRGVGLGLTQALVRECTERGGADLFLEVRAANVAARAIYERSGFAVAGRRKGYYADGEDAIVMHLQVSAC